MGGDRAVQPAAIRAVVLVLLLPLRWLLVF